MHGFYNFTVQNFIKTISYDSPQPLTIIFYYNFITIEQYDTISFALNL